MMRIKERYVDVNFPQRCDVSLVNDVPLICNRTIYQVHCGTMVVFSNSSVKKKLVKRRKHTFSLSIFYKNNQKLRPSKNIEKNTEKITEKFTEKNTEKFFLIFF